SRRRHARGTSIAGRRNQSPVLIPRDDTQTGGLDPLLAALCPHDSFVLHSKTPAFFIDILLRDPSSRRYAQFGTRDAVDRMCNASARYPWVTASHRSEEFANLKKVRTYLDAIVRRP